MKKKNLLNGLFAAVALTSCGSVKPFPDVDVCTAISGTNSNYAYCISYLEKSNREYRITESKIFEENYIMISPDHYAEIKKYVEYLKKESEKRCK